MVRIYNLALVALSASALAATTHDERRTVDDISLFDLAGRSTSLMGLDKRDEKDVDAAFTKLQEAGKDAEASIPEDKKKKFEEGKNNLKAIIKEVQESIPQDKKDKVTEAENNLRAAIKAANGQNAPPAPAAAAKF